VINIINTLERTETIPIPSYTIFNSSGRMDHGEESKKLCYSILIILENWLLLKK